MKEKSKTKSTKKKSSNKSSIKDEKYWVKFAKKKKVATPFFVHEHNVYRASDGKHYPSLDPFYADGGAVDGSNVTNL